LEKEAERRELELIELRAEAERSEALFHMEEQRAKDLLHELNRICSRTQTRVESERKG